MCKNIALQKFYSFPPLTFLTVACLRDCLMPSGGLIDMASLLSLLNTAYDNPDYHSLMPGQSQASVTAGVDRQKKTNKTTTQQNSYLLNISESGSLHRVNVLQLQYP